MGKSLTRIGVGPEGETVVADSETALELFFFKYGIAEPVEGSGHFANKLEYRAGLFDGNGLTRSVNDNAAFQYDVRLRWQPNGAVPLANTSGPLNSESDFESTDRPIYASG